LYVTVLHLDSLFYNDPLNRKQNKKKNDTLTFTI